MASAQELRINDARISSGAFRLGFVADTNWYYLLEFGGHPTGQFQPVSMLLPQNANGLLAQPLSHAAGFYRLHAVPRADPLDTDADGMDDVYELNREPEIGPLDPSDAMEDPDGDGLTRAQAYRALAFDKGAHKIAVGSRHFLALRPDGTLWACGMNHLGQLGDGTTNDSLEPILIEPGMRWGTVAAAGGAQSYGIQPDGSLWAWGYGLALGDGFGTNHLRPARIGQDNDWKALAFSQSHKIALKQNGTLWGWGRNEVGQLGNGTLTSSLTPAQIGNETNWAAVSVGQNFTLLLKSDGRAFACGHNSSGQLGIGTTNSFAEVPTPGASNFTWLSIAAGDFHGVGVRSDHTLWIWGSTIVDAGTGLINSTNFLAPMRVGTNANWLRVDAGDSHSVAMDTDGFLWSFGDNYLSGRLGDGTELSRFLPTRIAPGERWITMAVADGNHLAIRTDGTLWNWSGVNGQPTASNLFKAFMPGYRFQAIEAGDFHSLAIDEVGTVWTWGANEAGQLGDWSNESGMPRKIGTNIICSMISANGKHSVAVDQTNQLWMWGSMVLGQQLWGVNWPLNLGPDTVSEWRDIASGGDHWLALDRSGRILIYGDRSDSRTPNDWSSTNVYTDVSAGYLDSYAIDEEGALYIWGRFYSGGTLYSGRINLPGFKFREVIGGARHALVIRDDGTLWGIGNNTWGQLGIGTNSNPGTLVPVSTNTTWKTVSACYHNLAVRADKTLWYWGYDGNSSIVRTPIPLSTNGVWKAVAAGFNHSMALKEDGSLWVWGKNQYGQLGVSPFRQYAPQFNWRPPRPQ